MKDNNSLSHTTWNCKYHIVFAPKYRRQVIYGQIKVDIVKSVDDNLPDSVRKIVATVRQQFKNGKPVYKLEKIGKYQ
ncbi:MAG: transposase [Emergencia sp.]|nr:transposase [Emergencia sp.]